MGLEEAPVALRLDLGEHDFDRLRQAAVDPWRDLHDRPGLRRLEDEQANDPLHPGRAALRISRDDDVVRTRPIRTPAPAVDDPGSIFAPRALDEHGDSLPRPWIRRNLTPRRGVSDQLLGRRGSRGEALSRPSERLKTAMGTVCHAKPLTRFA